MNDQEANELMEQVEKNKKAEKSHRRLAYKLNENNKIIKARLQRAGYHSPKPK